MKWGGIQGFRSCSLLSWDKWTTGTVEKILLPVMHGEKHHECNVVNLVYLPIFPPLPPVATEGEGQ